MTTTNIEVQIVAINFIEIVCSRFQAIQKVLIDIFQVFCYHGLHTVSCGQYNGQVLWSAGLEKLS